MTTFHKVVGSIGTVLVAAGFLTGTACTTMAAARTQAARGATQRMTVPATFKATSLTWTSPQRG